MTADCCGVSPSRESRMDSMATVLKKVCKCENCGNEAEMILTCNLDPEAMETGGESIETGKAPTQRVRATATCSRCGNEADMWIDL